MKYLVVCTFLLAAIAECLAQEIIVGEEPATREICRGSSVTLRCSGPNIAFGNHLWTIGTSVTNAIVSLEGQLPNISGFIFTVTNTTDMLISTVQFTIEMSHDVICTATGGGNRQTNLILYDMTCPDTSAIGTSDFTGATVPLRNTSMCVQGYSVNVTGGAIDQSVTVSDTEVVVPISGLDLCNFMYKIIVTVMFIGGPMTCNPVQISLPEDGIGDLSVTANGNVVSWNLTSEFLMTCVSGYRLTYGKNPIMTMDVPKTETTFDLSRYNGNGCTVESVTVIALILNMTTSVTGTETLCEVTTSTTVTDFSTVKPSPSRGFPVWLIVIIVLVAVGTVLILLAVIIGCWKWRQHMARARSKRAEASAQMMQYDDDKQQEQMVKQQQADTHDFIPTYQDVNAIQRETVGPSNDVYTVVDKKKPKGSKKKSEKKDEMPMYSMVNKDKNSTDGNPEGQLVYTEVSVQSSSKSSRSRPPPPPGVAQLDANEPVVYSTVETPQQRH